MRLIPSICRNARRLSALVAAVLLFAAGEGRADCGERLAIETHDGTTTFVTIAGPGAEAQAVFVLLPGGGGHVRLDEGGCPRRLKGNSLIRKRPLFHQAGIATVLADAPSDHHDREGLGGFRIAADHAADIGLVIGEMRKRWAAAPIWLIGTSRGAISAVNAASRLTGAAAPDGLIVTSPVTSGFEGGHKAWVAHTVFSVDLGAIRMPVLTVAHAQDKCIRTPPDLAHRIAEKTNGAREQTVIVDGGPGWPGPESVKACRGKSPHGFVDQEEEVAAGMIRFARGGNY